MSPRIILAAAFLALGAGGVAAHDMNGVAHRHVPGGAGANSYAHNTPRVVEGGAVVGERYVPTIWIDPDGCEHWIMDDGWEGYMSPHLDRHGRPVCRQGRACGTFATGHLLHGHSLTHSGVARLQEFLRTNPAGNYIVTGHTSYGHSDRAQVNLSLRQANAVASALASAGARVIDIRGYGGRAPSANGHASDRIEIICLR
ncbi:MAG: OmpA family protein [Hasllibacter sp.]